MILDKDLIQKINLFEKLTGARVKDVFNSNGMLMIVNFGDIGRAVGKNGANVRKYSEMINEKIKIVEFNQNPIAFFKNLIMPLKIENVEKEDDFINVNADTKTKGLLIGRDRRNLSFYNTILKRYFNTEIKVK